MHPKLKGLLKLQFTPMSAETLVTFSNPLNSKNSTVLAFTCSSQVLKQKKSNGQKTSPFILLLWCHQKAQKTQQSNLSRQGDA